MFGGQSISLRHARHFWWDSNIFLTGQYRRNLATFRYSNYFRVLCACHSKFSDLKFSTSNSLDRNSIRYYTADTSMKCWNCNKNLKILKFSCLNCGVLQLPAPEMTYFELMDLPLKFDLNVDHISSKYKALQMLFHPDKYVRSSKEEIEISDTYSRLVNKAYSILKNPLTRGLYILQLKGIEADDNVKIEQEFLMEIMEKNEELETVNDAESLIKINEANIKAITDFTLMASEAFQGNDLTAAKTALMRLKYFINFENEIKKKKSELGIVD